MEANNRFLRVGQVADKLGCSKSTVWLWASDGKLPKPKKLSSRVSVWLEADIEAFIMKEYSKAAA